MYFIVLTNNPQVITKHSNLNPVPVKGDVRAVYQKARDLVHKGHQLLTHPLSSSLKPGRIPYKTVVLTAEPKQTVDLDSLSYMAAAMEAWDKTRPPVKLSLPPEVLSDYAEVDLSIFESALDSLLSSPGN
ncbi:MAG: GrdX protein [Firmicutes bacterium]|nr:GrdX protein [Bacillota bacterium]